MQPDLFSHLSISGNVTKRKMNLCFCCMVNILFMTQLSDQNVFGRSRNDACYLSISDSNMAQNRRDGAPGTFYGLRCVGLNRPLTPKSAKHQSSTEKNTKFHFSKMLKNKWRHAKVLPKRFRLISFDWSHQSNFIARRKSQKCTRCLRKWSWEWKRVYVFKKHHKIAA